MPTVPTLPGITSHSVRTPRLSVHVLESGPADGTPVVFVHGNVSSATFWEETMLALPEGFRAIAPDLRGYGDTDPEVIDATRGLGDFADDVWATLQAMGIDKAHLVGHSMGGGVVQQLLIDHADAVLSVTLVDTISPYGYGGSHGADGTPTTEDGAPTGVNPDFVAAIQSGDTGLDNPMSPKNVFRGFYVKPPFIPEREDALIASMLTTRTGDGHYPGAMLPSDNWPGAAPGTTGILPCFSRKYMDTSAFADVANRPPVLWIRGADDQIVADLAMFDLAALGQLGAIPGYPGVEACPPQQMLIQTRAVLDRYAANGGTYREVVIEDAGHSPYLEKPEAFNAALHAHLQS